MEITTVRDYFFTEILFHSLKKAKKSELFKKRGIKTGLFFAV
jgi:hypothetical protein